jgi:uncharacterized membrane protein
MIDRMLYGACAVALATATATAVMAEPSAADPQAGANKQICRSMADTGSRLGHSRACHTAQEWSDLRRQTRQNVDRIQTRQAMNADPTGQ